MELDLRYYDSTGKRKDIPASAVTSVGFEFHEQGGFQNGEVTLTADWSDLSATGTEYFDIRLFGATTVTYRGLAMQPTQELSDPPQWTFQLFGMMERTNGYLVRRDYAYSTYTDIGTIFQEIVSDWVSANISGLVVDVTGVSALNITLLSAKVAGKTASQAFNALLEYAPQSLIWGFDVDSSGANRIYLRPRSASVQDTYAVGGDITGLTYPRDVTQVANKIYVTGGTATVPNLAPNASFEVADDVTADSANLLFNGSFEQQTDPSGSRQNAWFWTNSGGAVRRQYPDDNPLSGNLSRTGNCYVEMTTSGATMSQPLINIGYPQPVVASLWARQNTNGDSEHFVMWIQEQDAAGTVLNTITTGDLTPVSNVYELFTHTFTPTQATTTQLTFGYNQNSAGGTGHGIISDDATITLSNATAASWQAGASVDAVFTTLDWQSRDYAYDGITSVKVTPNILVGGGYVEIRVNPQEMVNVKPGQTTYLTVWMKGAAGTAALGWREFADGVNTSTLGMATAEAISAGWTRLLYSHQTGATTNQIDPYIRIYDTSGNPVYIDAVMVTQGAAPGAGDFWKGANYEGIRDVTYFTGGELSSAASASISTYGLREKAESVDNITNATLLDAFAADYFNAYAIPAVQGRLQIKNATRLVALTGTLRVVNLTNAPPALFPSRVRYRIGESLDIDVDLNNQRPDMATLLRKVAAQAVRSMSQSTGASGASGGSGSGSGSPSYPSGAGVTAFNGATGDASITAGTGLSSSGGLTPTIRQPFWKLVR